MKITFTYWGTSEVVVEVDNTTTLQTMIDAVKQRYGKKIDLNNIDVSKIELSF